MLLLDNILFHFVISIICIYYEVYQQVKEDASFSKPASKKTQCNKRFGLILVVLIILCGLQMQKLNENYYNVLNVPFNATQQEIQEQYTKLAVSLSEDKSSTNLKEKRRLISQAQKTLLDESLRENYNRFGEVHINEDDKNSFEFLASFLVSGLAFYLLCACIGFIATIHFKLRRARQIFLISLVGMFCFEVHMRITGYSKDSSLPYWRNLLVFEKIELMKRLTPTILSFYMLLSLRSTKDVSKKQIVQLMMGVLATNRLLCQNLDQLSGLLDTHDKTNCTTIGQEKSFSVESM